jgi:hypothetical protein
MPPTRVPAFLPRDARRDVNGRFFPPASSRLGELYSVVLAFFFYVLALESVLFPILIVSSALNPRQSALLLVLLPVCDTWRRQAIPAAPDLGKQSPTGRRGLSLCSDTGGAHPTAIRWWIVSTATSDAQNDDCDESTQQLRSKQSTVSSVHFAFQPCPLFVCRRSFACATTRQPCDLQRTSSRVHESLTHRPLDWRRPRILC